MKNSKKGFAPIVILIIIAVAAIGGGAYYYSKVAPGEVIGEKYETWKGYENKEYGFYFLYPPGFNNLEEYPRGKECTSNTIGQNMIIKSVAVAQIDNLTIEVVCEPFTAEKRSISANIDSVQRQPTSISVAGKTAYEYEFVTATGYTWRIVQIPLNVNQYVQIGYTFGNSHRLNKNGYELSNKEWSDILASFKITPKSQTTSPSNQTSNWKTFTNTKYGFEFKYPRDWNTVSDTGDPSVIIKILDSKYPGIPDSDAPANIFMVKSLDSADLRDLIDGAIKAKNDWTPSSFAGVPTKLMHYQAQEITIIMSAVNESSKIEEDQILSTFKFTK